LRIQNPQLAVCSVALTVILACALIAHGVASGFDRVIPSSLAIQDLASFGRHVIWWLMSAVCLLLLAVGGLTYVMRRKLAARDLKLSFLEQRYRTILQRLDETVVLADPISGQLVDTNQAFSRLAGYADDEIKSLSVRNIYVDIEEVSRLNAEALSGRPRESRMRAKDGRLIETQISISLLIDEGKRFLCITGQDITLRKEAEREKLETQRQFARLVEHDTLTGLPNRIFLQTRMPKLLARLAGEERPLSLLYLDLDQFKNINDSHGHGVGDSLLKVIGQRLRECVSDNEIVIRMGGDEFVIIAPASTEPAVRELAQSVLSAISRPVFLGELSASVTASIGISVYPQDGLDAEALLKHADIALYQAKEQGRNVFQFFSDNMNLQFSEHVALEQSLRHAIGTDQLFVEYQPIVDLHSGMLVSFEALARWKHPELGLIPPIRFIPIAEKSGLILQLGEHVLRTVIDQLSQWQEQEVPLVPVAINIAPLQLERTSFSTLVHELAYDKNVDPKWLSFELTESAFIENSNKHIVVIDTLRHGGSKVYIDDFGTGFSNLSYLKQLPIDTIKIDRSFVNSIATDPGDAAIVGGIITMAKKLRLSLIAEGIETLAQLEKLRELGCDCGQGYYFSKPIAAGFCRALLEQMG
jgi:diguanylate cyclase (GGDEF)-like protein/PAS domain S-box-containing protein